MAMLLPLPTSPYTYRPLTLRAASAPGDAGSCGDNLWAASPSTSPERVSESIFTSLCCRASGRRTPLSTRASYRLRTSAPEPSCLLPASTSASPEDASPLFRPGVSASPRHGGVIMRTSLRASLFISSFFFSVLLWGARWTAVPRRGKRRVARDQEEMTAAEAAVSHAPACILASEEPWTRTYDNAAQRLPLQNWSASLYKIGRKGKQGRPPRRVAWAARGGRPRRTAARY